MAIGAIGTFCDEAADEHPEGEYVLDRFEVPNGMDRLMEEFKEKFPYDQDFQMLGRTEIFEECVRGETEKTCNILLDIARAT